MKYLDHIQYEMPYEVMKAQRLNVGLQGESRWLRQTFAARQNTCKVDADDDDNDSCGGNDDDRIIRFKLGILGNYFQMQYCILL